MNNNEIYLISGTVLGSLICAFTIFLVIKKWYWINMKSSKGRNIINSLELDILKDLRYWVKKNSFLMIEPSIYRVGTNQLFRADSIIITKKCLIVTKTQLIAGHISGSALDEKLIANVKDKKYKFTNPILINDQIIENLQRVITSKIPIVSLIIFIEKTRSIEVDNVPGHVVLTSQNQLFYVLKEMQIELGKFNEIQKEELDTIYYNIKVNITKDRKDKLAFSDIDNSQREIVETSRISLQEDSINKEYLNAKEKVS